MPVGCSFLTVPSNIRRRGTSFSEGDSHKRRMHNLAQSECHVVVPKNVIHHILYLPHVLFAAKRSLRSKTKTFKNGTIFILFVVFFVVKHCETNYVMINIKPVYFLNQIIIKIKNI